MLGLTIIWLRFNELKPNIEFTFAYIINGILKINWETLNHNTTNTYAFYPFILGQKFTGTCYEDEIDGR